MPAPIIGVAALAAARVLAAQIAKQTGKQLTKQQMKAVAIKVASMQKGKVSNVEARRIAEQVAGPKAKSPTGRVPSKVAGNKTGPVARITNEKITVSTPMKRAGKTKTDSTVTKSYQKTRVTPADRRAAMQAERVQRVRAALTPIKPRGTKSGGKAMVGAKENPRTVTVARSGKAKEINKLVTAPVTKMGKIEAPTRSTESRRLGMKGAAEDSRNVSQPINKTPRQRELEQTPDTNRVAPLRSKDAMQREADKRVAEGLKKLAKGKKARPDMAKTKARAPKYPKSTKARFRRETGGQ